VQQPQLHHEQLQQHGMQRQQLPPYVPHPYMFHSMQQPQQAQNAQYQSFQQPQLLPQQQFMHELMRTNRLRTRAQATRLEELEEDVVNLRQILAPDQGRVLPNVQCTPVYAPSHAYTYLSPGGYSPFGTYTQ
jgi:hypothetical protein